MHQVVPTVNYLFWAKCHPSKAFFPQNRLFPPITKPHPLNPLIACPPLLYWLGISVWCFGPCVLITLSSTFVFFHSYVVTSMSRSTVCLFYLCLSSTKRCMGFWVCLISPHSLMGLFACLA